jgi:hypothetical protein
MEMVSGNTASEKRTRSWSRAASPDERIAKPRRTGEAERSGRSTDEIVDEWGRQSFPASDPPSNW